MARLALTDRLLRTALVVLCLFATGPFHELLHGEIMANSGQLEWHRGDCDHLPAASEHGDCAFLAAAQLPSWLDRPAPVGLSPLSSVRLLSVWDTAGHPSPLNTHRIGARAPPRTA